jgi:hypothetical protein
MKFGPITLMMQYTIMLSTKISFKKHFLLASSRLLRHTYLFSKEIGECLAAP